MFFKTFCNEGPEVSIIFYYQQRGAGYLLFQLCYQQVLLHQAKMQRMPVDWSLRSCNDLRVMEVFLINRQAYFEGGALPAAFYGDLSVV